MSEGHVMVNGHCDRADSPNDVQPEEPLDAIIVGAGYYFSALLTIHLGLLMYLTYPQICWSIHPS